MEALIDSAAYFELHSNFSGTCVWLSLRYTVSVINEARLIGNVQRFLNSNEPNFPDFVQTLVTHRFTSSE